jgi:hypothetical protein
MVKSSSSRFCEPEPVIITKMGEFFVKFLGIESVPAKVFFINVLKTNSSVV